MKAVDATVGPVLATIVPVLHALPGLLPSVLDSTAEVATASMVWAAGAAASGIADIRWPIALASGVSPTTIALPAAALGIGIFVLLFSRRFGLVNSALPSSPVYETDTSPD